MIPGLDLSMAPQGTSPQPQKCTRDLRLESELERVRNLNLELVTRIGRALMSLRDRPGDSLQARAELAMALELAKAESTS